ncbi:MAG: ABC transporter permease [Lachnospiraceae bacterium]|nr:ABC transporter permease [Lachnospiraceae bacterium]
MFRKKEKRWVMKTEKGQWGEIWANFRKNGLAMAAFSVLLLIIAVALFADVGMDYTSKALGQNAYERLLGPSAAHWFGTDQYGRDLFARVIYGARYSLLFGVGCTGVALLLGSVIGAVAAYYGGKLDSILMRLLDALMCIPSMLLILLLVAVMGSGLVSLTVAITITSVPGFTRMTRSVVLSVVQQDFIEAARSCGTKDRNIILHHVIPNAVGPIIVNGMMNIAGIIMSAAGMSYIGLGINPPTPEWGSMLSEATQFMRTSPHVVIFPGLAIVITSLCFNLVGDGLADAVDPRQRD